MQSVVHSYDEASRKDLAAKTDLQGVRAELQVFRMELKEAIANTKHEILKWMLTTMVAQTALIVAVMAFLQK